MQRVIPDLHTMRHSKPWVHAGREPGVLRELKPRACKQQVSGKKNSNVIVLRCECMSEIEGALSRRFFGYDPIGVFNDLSELLEAWNAHLKEKAGRS